jgi:hypothetical protein
VGFSALISMSSEPRGGNCSAGGVRIDVGLDNGEGGGNAGDLVLQPGEVDQTRYVCNADPVFNAGPVASSTTVPASSGIAMTVAWDGASYWLATTSGVWTMNPQTLAQTPVPLAGSPSPRSVFTMGDGTSPVYLFLGSNAAVYNVTQAGYTSTGTSLQTGAADLQVCWDDLSSEFIARDADNPDTFLRWSASGVARSTIVAQPGIPLASWPLGVAMHKGRFIVYNHATHSLDAYNRAGVLTETVALSDYGDPEYGVSVANNKVWVSFVTEWRAYDVLR